LVEKGEKASIGSRVGASRVSESSASVPRINLQRQERHLKLLPTVTDSNTKQYYLVSAALKVAPLTLKDSGGYYVRYQKHDEPVRNTNSYFTRHVPRTSLTIVQDTPQTTDTLVAGSNSMIHYWQSELNDWCRWIPFKLPRIYGHRCTFAN
jgi:hypothetical protein